MGRIRRYGLTAAICAGALAAGMLVSYRAMPQIEAQGGMRPFVAQVIEKHFAPDGTLAPLPGGIDYITIGRKSDGSQVRFLPLQAHDGSFALLRSIFDVSGKDVKLFPSTMSVMTYYIAPVHVSHHIEAFESCPPAAGDPRAERSSRLGYDVVRITTEETNSKGTDKDNRWVAPALNCFALAETYTSSLGSRNEYETINIFEGEPPDSWFVVPKGYIERSPSQVAAAFAARFPGQEWMSDQFLPMADRVYYLHRGNKK